MLVTGRIFEGYTCFPLSMYVGQIPAKSVTKWEEKQEFLNVNLPLILPQF